jgi:putative mRNA 3-end processing factor
MAPDYIDSHVGSSLEFGLAHQIASRAGSRRTMTTFGAKPLISWSPAGLYCEAGGFHIDPHRPVETAVITHAHSDHARRGSKRYFCVDRGVGLLRARLGKSIEVSGIPYGSRFQLGSATLSFHSAGHILGSAQVRVRVGDSVWVASGDYKRDADPSCDPFEPVACDTFISEATFGTPKYLWDKNRRHGRDIFDWWQGNAAANINSVLFGYSLGKCQRILAELAPFAGKPVWIHPAMAELTDCYRIEGVKLAPTRILPRTPDSLTLEKLEGELLLAPPSVLKGEWRESLGRFRTAFASGWMQGRETGNAYRGQDHGFVMSDHADWNDINRTIDETGASRVFIFLRSGNGALVRHLRSRGIDAHGIDALEPENFARIPPKNLSLF